MARPGDRIPKVNESYLASDMVVGQRQLVGDIVTVTFTKMRWTVQTWWQVLDNSDPDWLYVLFDHFQLL